LNEDGQEPLLDEKIDLGIKRFDHVGIAVENVDEALSFYQNILQAQVISYRKLSFSKDYTWTQFSLGSQLFELIEPVKKKPSFLTRFLEKYGEGLHHLTFEVENIKKAISILSSKNIRITDESFDDPAWQTAFISPRSSHGVLIQMYENSADKR
jgi:methylmalonyl-CoA/ethylmalonyl-CoA epimerase